jgi:hypothetical protein
MFRFAIPTVLAGTTLLVSSPSHESTALGCAAVPPKGGRVEIAEESAVIIWDAPSKTEHFIRRASFKTAAKDFGFLVPTPSRPKLAEADDSVFRELERITAPPVRVRQESSGGCSIGCDDRKAVGPPGNSVSVLEEKRVAGFDAAVLAATDAAALNKWLADHGYESSDVLKKWIEPYVQKGWIITAFKVAKPDGKQEQPAAVNTTLTAGPKPHTVPADWGVSTSTVRMSFQTDKPFYPYREPEDQRGPEAGIAKRLLRVYFIGTERMEGTIGQAGEWKATVPWSKTIHDVDRTALLTKVKLDNEPFQATWWLTEFEDRSSPRPGTDDVFFHVAKEQRTSERAAIDYPGRRNGPGRAMFAACGLALCMFYAVRLVRGRTRLG